MPTLQRNKERPQEVALHCAWSLSQAATPQSFLCTSSASIITGPSNHPLLQSTDKGPLGAGRGPGDPLMNKTDKTHSLKTTLHWVICKSRCSFAYPGLGPVRRQRGVMSGSPSSVFLDPQSFSRIWPSLKIWEISQTWISGIS